MSAPRERMSLYVPTTDAAQLRAYAAQHQISVNDAARAALRLLSTVIAAQRAGKHVVMVSERDKPDAAVLLPVF